jgi:hypothetical protein
MDDAKRVGTVFFYDKMLVQMKNPTSSPDPNITGSDEGVPFRKGDR